MATPSILHLPRRLWVWSQVGTRSSASTGLTNIHHDAFSTVGGVGPLCWHPAIILEVRVDPDRFPENDDVALSKGWGDMVWSPKRFRVSECPIPPPSDKPTTAKRKTTKSKPSSREEVLLGQQTESAIYRSCYLGCRVRKAPQAVHPKQTGPMLPWDFLYYVHFKGRNRRHDKWRRLDDMIPIECNPSTPETLSASLTSLTDYHRMYPSQDAWMSWLEECHGVLDRTSPFAVFFDSNEKKRSTRRNPRPPSGGPLEWAGPEAASLQEVTPLLALAWTRSAWLLMCNEKYPEPVFDETLTKRKPSKVIANDFLPRQVSIVANFRHFVGRSKRYHDDSETRPTKKRKIRGADSPSSMSLVNAETPLADCTESRMAAYAGPLTYLTPVLSDVALHGSLGDTDCEEYACMEAGAQSLHEEMTLVKSVERVAFGDAVVDTWYFSPYPRKVQPVETLFVCEWCLDYFKFKLEFLYHQKHCSAQHPPGNEIFRMDKLSLFEVDGAKCQQYCRNLCFFGKLFLDHKTLQYDTEPFLFYCLTEVSPRGCHLVGYFSKEKVSDMGYNLSCIVTWPHHQRKSFGKILQTMSYTLSLCEGKMGSPEKPLSDLGAAAYDSYWLELLVTLLTNLRLDDGGEPSSDEDSLYNSPSLLDTAVQRLLRRCRQPEADAEGLAVSVDDLSFATAITRSDISSVLYRTNILRNIGGKQVLWLPASEIAKHLQCTGRPCRSVPPARFHFVPWSAAAPRSHEALPPGTTGAKNGSYKV